MFLIRSAFLLVLLVAILPSDPKEQARLYETASHAVQRAVTFCDRHAEFCAKAEAHWEVFKVKAAIGGRMLVDLVNEQVAGKTATPPPAVVAPRRPSIDTLAPADRRPPWQGNPRTSL